MEPRISGLFCFKCETIVCTVFNMKKIVIQTQCKKLLSDIYTPVGIYLRLRDRFRDTILLESTDSHAAENSYSFICINAIGGIEITDKKSIEFKLPGHTPERVSIGDISKGTKQAEAWGMEAAMVSAHGLV